METEHKCSWNVRLIDFTNWVVEYNSYTEEKKKVKSVNHMCGFESYAFM